jgi:hypothetical protein
MENTILMSARLTQWLLLALGSCLGLWWLWAIFWQLDLNYPFGIEVFNRTAVPIGWLPIIRKPVIW